MRFHTTIELNGRTATGMEVPPDVIAALDAGKRPRVRVAIGNHSYRSTVATRQGRYLLPVSGENRLRAGVVVGDEVEVEIELDRAPRDVEVPADFAHALNRDFAAASRFEQLSYSRKLRFVLGIEGARRPDTRKRRVASAIDTLRAEVS